MPQKLSARKRSARNTSLDAYKPNYLRMTQCSSSKQFSDSTAYSEIFSESFELPFIKGNSPAYRRARYSEKRRDRTLDKSFEDFISNDHVSALKKLEVTLSISDGTCEPTQCFTHVSRRERNLDTAFKSIKVMKRRKQVTKNKGAKRKLVFLKRKIQALNKEGFTTKSLKKSVRKFPSPSRSRTKLPYINQKSLDSDFQRQNSDFLISYSTTARSFLNV
ncbi:unnamed protein product [Moneuplotes crassus]|uniref:Uncharacterized protein n=1 Tax=Euplotes crassus TaxID=5936 RepID=A0AAD1XER8_EUPCR|nr:unnamed protein product [Moneuplotes crassus]